MHTFGVNFLFYDEWNFFPIFSKFFDGTLGLSDFFAQHTESRMVIPRVIILISGLITKWNVKFEMYLIQFIQLTILVFLLLISKHTLKNTLKNKTTFFILLCFLASSLLFSLSQWRNFVTSFQIVMYLPTLWLILALYLSIKNETLGKQFFQGAICALLATFSFANGIFTWIVIPIPALFTKETKLKNKALFLLLWIAAASITGFLYFNNFVQPPKHPGLSTMFEKPAEVFQNVLLLIALPFKSPLFNFTAKPLGLFALTSTIVLSVYLLFLSGFEKRKKAAPWVALSAYAFGTVLVIANGRTDLGEIALLSPRYNAFTIYCWIPLLFLFALAFEDIKLTYPFKVITTGLLIFLVSAHLSSNAQALTKLSIEEQTRRKGISAVQLLNIAPHFDVGHYTTPDGKNLIINSKKLSAWGYRPKQLTVESINYDTQSNNTGEIFDEIFIENSTNKSLVYVSSFGKLYLPDIQNKNIVVLATVKTSNEGKRRIAAYSFLDGTGTKDYIFSQWQIRFLKVKSEIHELWILDTTTGKAKLIPSLKKETYIKKINYVETPNPYSRGNFELIEKLGEDWRIINGWVNTQESSAVVITKKCIDKKRELLLATFAGIFRPDVEQKLGISYRNSGWRLAFVPDRSDVQNCKLRAWSYNSNNGDAYLMGGERDL